MNIFEEEEEGEALASEYDADAELLEDTLDDAVRDAAGEGKLVVTTVPESALLMESFSRRFK